MSIGKIAAICFLNPMFKSLLENEIIIISSIRLYKTTPQQSMLRPKGRVAANIPKAITFLIISALRDMSDRPIDFIMLPFKLEMGIHIYPKQRIEIKGAHFIQLSERMTITKGLASMQIKSAIGKMINTYIRSSFGNEFSNQAISF